MNKEGTNLYGNEGRYEGLEEEHGVVVTSGCPSGSITGHDNLGTSPRDAGSGGF
jgi:hypothetical protein